MRTTWERLRASGLVPGPSHDLVELDIDWGNFRKGYGREPVGWVVLGRDPLWHSPRGARIERFEAGIGRGTDTLPASRGFEAADAFMDGHLRAWVPQQHFFINSSTPDDSVFIVVRHGQDIKIATKPAPFLSRRLPVLDRLITGVQVKSSLDSRANQLLASALRQVGAK
jgi:hypothetical protein